MPRLPLIVESQPLQLAGGPSPNLRAWGAPGEAVGEAGARITNVGEVWQQAQKLARDAAAKLDAEQALSDAKILYAQEEGKVKTDATITDPKKYADILDAKRREILGQAEQAYGQKYPEYRGLFRSKSLPFTTESAIAAQHEGIRRESDRLQVLGDVQDVEDANQAVMNPSPIKRAEAVASFNDRTATLLPIRGPAATRAAVERFNKNVWQTQAKIDFETASDAEKPKVLVELATEKGKYRVLDPNERHTLIDSMFTKWKAEQRDRMNEEDAYYKSVEEEAKREQRIQVDELDRRAATKTLSMVDLVNSNKAGVTVGEDYRRLLREITAPTHDLPSHAPTRDRLAILARRSVPISTLGAEIDAALERGPLKEGLNYPDYNQIKGQWQSRKDHVAAEGRAIEGEGRAIENRNLSHAEQVLYKGIGFTGAMEQYTQEHKQFIDVATREFMRRSIGGGQGGTENPAVVATEIADRIGPTALGSMQLKLEKQAATARFKTKDQLEAARSRLTPEEYQKEMAKVVELNRKLKEAEELANQHKEKAPGAWEKFKTRVFGVFGQ